MRTSSLRPRRGRAAAVDGRTPSSAVGATNRVPQAPRILSFTPSRRKTLRRRAERRRCELFHRLRAEIMSLGHGQVRQPARAESPRPAGLFPGSGAPVADAGTPGCPLRRLQQSSGPCAAPASSRHSCWSDGSRAANWGRGAVYVVTANTFLEAEYWRSERAL